MTLKGLKMNITKCLKGFNLEQSKKVKSSIRGQHEFTNGFAFIDDNAHEITLHWIESNITFEERLEKMRKIHNYLVRYGFSEYMTLSENFAYIILRNFKM